MSDVKAVVTQTEMVDYVIPALVRNVKYHTDKSDQYRRYEYEEANPEVAGRYLETAYAHFKHAEACRDLVQRFENAAFVAETEEADDDE